MAQPPKIHEVKKVYERNKRNNNVHQIKALINLNLVRNPKPVPADKQHENMPMFNPIHCQNICFLPQKELRKLDDDVERMRPKEPKSLANKFITLTGASQSLTSFQLQRKRMEKEEKHHDLEQKRIAIIQNCPSLADFYENYLTKKAKKSKQEQEFEDFINKYEKRFDGFSQYLYIPERKIMHKNKRFIRYDDVDMGDEVEAAIYNDGRKAPKALRKYVDLQMNKLLGKKLNQRNVKVKTEEYDDDSKSTKIDIDTLIDKNKYFLGSGQVKNLRAMIYNSHQDQSMKSMKSKYNDYNSNTMKSMSQNELIIAKKFLTQSVLGERASGLSGIQESQALSEDEEGYEEKEQNEPDDVSLVPAIARLMGILEPKSHCNFLNMVVKNQNRTSTAQKGSKIKLMSPQQYNRKDLLTASKRVRAKSYSILPEMQPHK